MRLLIILIMLSLISIASASDPISSKVTWSESPAYFLGMGDYIVTNTYSDGFEENVYHRGALTSLGSIYSMPYKITTTTTSNTLIIPITLQGQSCALSTLYSLHHVGLYRSSSNDLLYGINTGMILCGKTSSLTLNVPKSSLGSIGATPGTYSMVIKETMWNTAGMSVTETRLFTLEITGTAPTPTPTPTPSTGTISISSNPDGATVRINSDEKGYTPISFTMPPGNYIVSTSLSGYKTDNYGMTVIAGKTVSHSVNLVPLGTPTPTSTPTGTPTSSPTLTPTGTPGPNPCPAGYHQVGSNCVPDSTSDSTLLIIIPVILIIAAILYVALRGKK